MGITSKFKFKVHASDAAKNEQTVSAASDIKNAPANTTIEKDDGAQYIKNAKGVWDKTGSASSTATVPFDVAQFINGKPLTNEVLVKVIAPRQISLPQNLVGSYMKSGIAATSNTVLTVYKNGTSQGTITFSAGATTGTISTSAITLNAGDILSVVAPTTVDSSFADFACVITGSM